VASEAIRRGRLPREADVQTRGHEITLSVAEPTLRDWTSIGVSSCVRYLVAILPYGKAKGKGWLEGDDYARGII
jgi:hypothetical protein